MGNDINALRTGRRLQVSIVRGDPIIIELARRIDPSLLALKLKSPSFSFSVMRSCRSTAIRPRQTVTELFSTTFACPPTIIDIARRIDSSLLA